MKARASRAVRTRVGCQLLFLAAMASYAASLCMALMFVMGDAGLPAPFDRYWSSPVWEMSSPFLPMQFVAWKGFGAAAWVVAGMAVALPLFMLAQFCRSRLPIEEGSRLKRGEIEL